MDFLPGTGKRELPPKANWPVAGLGLILLAYLALAGIYNVANPIFEAPDEVWHYNFVRYLSQYRSLPVEDRSGVLTQAEAGQPPVYYAVAALLTGWAPRGDLAAIARSNPSGSIGDPRTVGNKNRFLHGPDQAFPWRGEVLTVHLVRLTTTLWGLLAVVLTYLIGREVFASPLLALASAAVVAFTPQFLLMSAAVSNDVPVGAASALLLWLAVRATRARPTLGRSLGLGVLAGFAILVKPMSAGGVAIALAALLIASRRHRLPFRVVAANEVVLVAATLATCGWWFARNVAIYHSAAPLITFLDFRPYLFNQVPSLPAAIGDLVGLKMSYWALFGWFSIVAPPAYDTFFDALMALAAVGWLVALGGGVVRPGLREGLDRAGLALVAAWGVIVFLALCFYRLIVLAFQGRLLFPAVAAYAVLLVLGWSRLAPPRLGGVVAGGLALALVVPAARAPWTMLAPAFRPPPVVAASAVHPAFGMNARFGDDARLLGADVSPPVGSRLAPGDDVQVTLYWQGLRPMQRDYEVSVQVNDLAQRKLAIVDSMPGLGTLPTSAWEPGKVVVDRYHLKLGADATGPAIARVSVALYLRDTLATLPAYDASGAKLPLAPSIGPYVIAGPADLARARAGVPFGGMVSLVDAKVDQSTAEPGGAITGRLLFGGLAPMSRDYTIFVHLEGDRGFVAGDDSPPLRGQFPTTFWRPGDLVRQEFRLLVPANTPPGLYHVRAGWYDLATGQRLATPGGDSVDLGQVTVD